VTVTTPTFRKYLSGVMWGLSLGTRLPNLKFVPSPVLEQTDRQTRRGLSVGVVNGDHAHLLDTRHPTSAQNDFRVFQCAVNAVHWTDNKQGSRLTFFAHPVHDVQCDWMGGMLVNGLLLRYLARWHYACTAVLYQVLNKQVPVPDYQYQWSKYQYKYQYLAYKYQYWVNSQH